MNDPVEFEVNDSARAEVLERYARHDNRPGRTHRVQTCRPSAAELESGLVGARKPKVIFADRASALAAARELQALGAAAMKAYECKRSQRGHWHLTSEGEGR